MLTEGYSIHAYCEKCSAFGEGFGDSRAEAARELKRMGWHVGIRGGRAYCPRHHLRTPRPEWRGRDAIGLPARDGVDFSRAPY